VKREEKQEDCAYTLAAERKAATLGLVAMVALGAMLAAEAWPVPANDAADAAMAAIRTEGIRAGMRFLADDLLEGRGTATMGHEIAAKYMASQFEGIGLQPAGDNGTYFQEVPLRKGQVDETKTSLTLLRDGNEQKLVFRENFIAIADADGTETSVEAPVVFAGDGITAPELGYDDYKGIDARGKIVVFVFGAPNFESTLKAYYSSSDVKTANAVAHGAVGFILLDDPVLEQIYPFKEIVRALAFPQFHWLDRQGKPNDYWPELKGHATLNPGGREQIFRGKRPYCRGSVRGDQGRQADFVLDAVDGENSQRIQIRGREEPECGGEARG
jgi:PA domain